MEGSVVTFGNLAGRDEEEIEDSSPGKSVHFRVVPTTSMIVD